MDILEIKKYLKAHKITYKKLSEMSGVPESTLKNIFGGFTSNPRMDTIEAIERALGINKQDAPPTQESKGQESKGLVIPEKYKDLMVAFSGGDEDLTQEDIQSVINFVEFLKQQRKK